MSDIKKRRLVPLKIDHPEPTGIETNQTENALTFARAWRQRLAGHFVATSCGNTTCLCYPSSHFTVPQASCTGDSTTVAKLSYIVSSRVPCQQSAHMHWQ